MYFGADSICYRLRDEMHAANIMCSCGGVCYRYVSLAYSCIQLLGACPFQSVACYSPRRLAFVSSGVDAEFLVENVTPGHVFLSVFRSHSTSFDSTNARFSTVIHRMGPLQSDVLHNYTSSTSRE
jgi:hypothetical protein